MTVGVDRGEFRQIIAGRGGGVILGAPDQTNADAKAAALAMHGTETVDEPSETVDAYRECFVLRDSHNHTPNQYPMERVVSGDSVRNVIVAGPQARRGRALRSHHPGSERRVRAVRI